MEITRVAGASMPETWFNNIRIDINPGLVAIIGNKGSGKSALTDILALCANTKNEAFSFLTSNKFRMNKPYNRSKQIEAIIGWADKSHSQKKTLDESPDINQPERVKYIPQNFSELSTLDLLNYIYQIPYVRLKQHRNLFIYFKKPSV